MMQRYASKRLSKEERRVDALALRAEERREIYREIYESQFKKEDLRKNGGAGNV